MSDVQFGSPRRSAYAALPVAAFMVLASSALGQEPGRLANTDKGIVQWAVAIGLMILICAAAFMNPKRTHLD